jgi:hypothetical protein
MEKEVIFNLIGLASSAFLTILFLQSGWDKIRHRSGNAEWLRVHFSKTAFRSMVPLLLTVLTVLEILTGILSAIGFVVLLIWSDPFLATMGYLMAAVTILSLFMGQRLAKDYAGAAALTGYFLIVMVALYVISF